MLYRVIGKFGVRTNAEFVEPFGKYHFKNAVTDELIGYAFDEANAGPEVVICKGPQGVSLWLVQAGVLGQLECWLKKVRFNLSKF